MATKKKSKRQTAPPRIQGETYIARKRSMSAHEMKCNHPKAYLLLDEIAVHARRKAGEVKTQKGFTYHLEAGEALVPPWNSMGKMFESREEHRHALKVLRDKYGQIKCRTAGSGRFTRSIAKLVSTDIFDVNEDVKSSIDAVKDRVKKAVEQVEK